MFAKYRLRSDNSLDTPITGESMMPPTALIPFSNLSDVFKLSNFLWSQFPHVLDIDLTKLLPTWYNCYLLSMLYNNPKRLISILESQIRVERL